MRLEELGIKIPLECDEVMGIIYLHLPGCYDYDYFTYDYFTYEYSGNLKLLKFLGFVASTELYGVQHTDETVNLFEI
jgi:hypothetical protein